MMKDKILTMLTMQDSMNQKVHPNWTEQNFEWYRAAWIECGELMDHQGYKWWKKQTPETEQVKLEIIDIWHFALSDLFKAGQSIEVIADKILSQLQGFTYNGENIHVATEILAQKCLANKRVPIVEFWQLMHAAALNFNDLYVAYVGKNVLNFFRQDHGYKDGSYIKQWQGREDNEHLSEIVAQLDQNSPSFRDEVYSALSKRYELVEA